MNQHIGGYFELELSRSQCDLYPDTVRVQSARAAFTLLLRACRPSAVWMPRFICDAMLSPLLQLNIPVNFYDLNDDLGTAGELPVGEGEILLFVNYFGIFSEQVDRVREWLAPKRLVLDHSQALYAPPPNCLATTYSPRKFLGLPNGGLLHTHMAIQLPDSEDDSAIANCQHLLLRTQGNIAAGYGQYQKAEASLDDIEPRRMSRLSNRLMHACDHSAVAAARRRNFEHLHQHFKSRNRLSLKLGQAQVPLCYPLWLDREVSRSRLAEREIYIPVYWREVLSRVGHLSFEHALTRQLLPLPCDQRYDCTAMDRLIGEVEMALGQK